MGEASQPIARRTAVSVKCSRYVTHTSANEGRGESKSQTAMRKSKNSSKERKGEDPPSQHVDARILELSDWRVEMLARVRRLIREADPEVVEEVKWRKPSNPAGVPVWSHDGILCTGETYKNVVKLTFAKGASLPDPAGLFNSSLEGSTRRAIDLHQGDRIDEQGLQALLRAPVALNASARSSVRPVRSKAHNSTPQ